MDTLDLVPIGTQQFTALPNPTKSSETQTDELVLEKEVVIEIQYREPPKPLTKEVSIEAIVDMEPVKVGSDIVCFLCLCSFYIVTRLFLTKIAYTRVQRIFC